MKVVKMSTQLGVQVVLVSRSGAVIPVALTLDQGLTRLVGQSILETWRQRRFGDDAMARISQEHEQQLRRLLAEHGLIGEEVRHEHCD